MTSTRNTASAMSACRVIWLPQVPLTSLMLIADCEGVPDWPNGWNRSNRACLSARSG